MARIPRGYKKHVRRVIAGLQREFPETNVMEEFEKDPAAPASLSEKAHPNIPGFVVSIRNEEYDIKVYVDPKRGVVVKFLVGDSPLDEEISPVMWAQDEKEEKIMPDIGLICERVRKEFRVRKDFQTAVAEVNAQRLEEYRYPSMHPQRSIFPGKRPPKRYGSKTA
ncbi:MAG: hypothetical protein HGB03_03975 [Candidatus Yonathbacteria bacterium]|nr:hypothetical protein [Candidatus Yonathbacteria bacterium]NTW47610.1 hypothetical protein [Candidatus Yonathbacteria bacterium]